MFRMAYYDRCFWVDFLLNDYVSQTNRPIAVENDKVYFFNQDGKVSNLYRDFAIPSALAPIHMRGRNFYKGNSIFYPVVQNYDNWMSVKANNIYTNSRHPQYNGKDINGNANPECSSKASCILEIENDLTLMKEEGFNTVRLTGFELKDIWDTNTLDLQEEWDWRYYIDWPEKIGTIQIQDEVIELMADFLDLAESKDMKVILLIGGHYMHHYDLQGKILDYFDRISSKTRINGHPALLAYDLYNEPNWDSELYYPKSDLCYIVNNWIDVLHTNDPSHLITINLWNSEDLFNWDPALFNIDFVSWHPYEPIKPLENLDVNANALLRLDIIKNEMYFYKRLNIPWIIGEFGYSVALDAMNINFDEGTEAMQSFFAISTIETTKDCGGLGYSWWNFCERYISSPPQQDDFFGMHSPPNNTPKLAADDFQNFNFTNVSSGACAKPVSFENPFGHTTFVGSGVVRDNSSGNPLIKSVIVGKSASGESYKTFTDNFGFYQLYSDKPISELRVVSPGYESKSLNQLYFFQDIRLQKITGCNGSAWFYNKSESLLNSDDNVHMEIDVKAYPNPFNNIFVVASEQTIFQVDIFSSSSSLVLSSLVNSNKIELNTTDLPMGIYFVKVEVEGGRQSFFKIIKL